MKSPKRSGRKFYDVAIIVRVGADGYTGAIVAASDLLQLMDGINPHVGHRILGADRVQSEGTA